MDSTGTDVVTEAAGLLVVGELCVDIIVNVGDDIPFGQAETLVESTTLTLGSSSAITACGAATLGVPTTMVGVVGADVFGQVVTDELARRGVDVGWVRVDPATPTGASTHLSRRDGDRAILTSLGTIGAVTAADVPDSLFEARAHLHVGSYFLQSGLWDEAPELFRRARAHGLSTSLDGNYDPAGAWDAGILNLLPLLDVFFGNEQELRGITGAASAEMAVESALDTMPEGAIVVCKLGADGAVAAWREAGETRRLAAGVPAMPGVLVDTVGAGDSLASGFLAARLGSESLADCLAVAVACGTASTRGAGGVGAQASREAAWDLARSVTVQRA